KVHGKNVLPMAGQYTAEVIQHGLSKFLAEVQPAGVDLRQVEQVSTSMTRLKSLASEKLGGTVPARPPSFCTGCPERPVFSAIKLVQRELGPTHIACDIGCHTFSTLPPFNLGQSVVGYGLGLASSTGIAPSFKKRVISIMGDGGFWH